MNTSASVKNPYKKRKADSQLITSPDQVENEDCDNNDEDDTLCFVNNGNNRGNEFDTTISSPVPVNESMFFYATPFGAFCSLCNKQVGKGFSDKVSRTLLKNHVTNKKKTNKDDIHPSKPSLSYTKQAQLLNAKINDLRPQLMSFVNWDSHFFEWICVNCDQVFSDKRFGMKHLKEKKHKDLREVSLYITLCGRKVSKQYLIHNYSLNNVLSQWNNGMYVRM